MLREIVAVIVPLLLPTALYLLWVWVAQAPSEGGGKPRWRNLPWPWLAGAGALLVGVVLFFITIGYGTSGPGTYVPSRWINGHIVTGHFDNGAER